MTWPYHAHSGQTGSDESTKTAGNRSTSAPGPQVAGNAESQSTVEYAGGGAKKRKMSSKERYEFVNLEKAIDALSERVKELERLLEGAHEAGTGYAISTPPANAKSARSCVCVYLLKCT